MKIYCTADILIDNHSAPSIHVNEICKNLNILGNTVKLYVPDSNSKSIIYEYPVNFLYVPRFFKIPFFQTYLFFRLLVDCIIDRPDLIYSRYGVFFLAPSIIAKFLKINTVIEINGFTVEEFKKYEKNFFARLLLYFGLIDFIESFVVRNSSGVIVTSIGIKNYLTKKYDIDSAKIIVMSSGVDVNFFKPKSLIETREKLKLDLNKIYIGYVGGLYEWQGLRYVFEAINSVCSSNKSVKFLIVGSGPDFEYLDTYVKKNSLQDFVEIRTAVPHSLVPDYVNSFDICLCYVNKFRDGATSPFKVYEYLACSKPVILSDLKSLNDEFGKVVKYVKPESPEFLANEIISLINDKHELDRLSQTGRKFVEEDHSWKIVAERTNIFLNNIVQNKI